jgi:MraZ protein
MLLGAYEHTIDDKNRLTLPAKFRESFAQGTVVVTRGLDGCLEVFRGEDWARRVESRLAPLDPSARRRGSSSGSSSQERPRPNSTNRAA